MKVNDVVNFKFKDSLLKGIVKNVCNDSDYISIVDSTRTTFSVAREDIIIDNDVEELVEFREGDIVDYGGVEHIVNVYEPDAPYTIILYPLLDTHGIGYVDSFTSDGRVDVNHTKPLITLVRRAKKKVTKVVEMKMYAVIEVDTGPMFYMSNVESISPNYINNIDYKIVELKGSYEVTE